jgi:peptide/nickel transport system ATP-binding protein
VTDRQTVVSVRDLRVELANGADIVADVSFDIGPGEVLALVGESGCGKTATAMACLGFARRGTRIGGGRIEIAGTDVLSLRGAELRGFRGRQVAYVPQDPSVTLNPGMRIGEQLAEMLEIHLGAKQEDRDTRVAELLRSVHLPDSERFQRRYPHQISGGQQQRLLIAAALSCEPSLVLLDEPTTGLDVTTQSRILDLFNEVRAQRAVSMLYVTHDLAVVSQLADHVAVMYSGRIVETAPCAELFRHPRHPYTQRLIEAVPASVEQRRRIRGIPGSAAAPGERPVGCFFAPRCTFAAEVCVQPPPLLPATMTTSVACHRWNEIPPHRGMAVGVEPAEPARAPVAPILAVHDLEAGYQQAESARALEHVSLALAPRETLGIVGESGSGKTTLARCIVGLHEPSGGSIEFAGAAVPARARHRSADVRRRIQIVFQNPDGSLNPRQSVEQIVGRPLQQFLGLRGPELAARVRELLELVRLPATAVAKFPRDLSGGEKQRVAIAAAIAPDPDILVCDEVTSALDVSVQAAVIELLGELRNRRGLSLLFISHDLAVVRSIADHVLVLESGHVREAGPVETVFNAPTHAYTQALLAAIPQISDVQRPPERVSSA